jgi:hypothetical protein
MLGGGPLSAPICTLAWYQRAGGVQKVAERTLALTESGYVNLPRASGAEFVLLIIAALPSEAGLPNE